MQRTDYVFKVANRSKTESQNSKQNHKTQNRITKLKTESQTRNINTKHKTESQNPKQNHKTRITKLKTESQNPKQNHPRSSIENDTRFQNKMGKM